MPKEKTVRELEDLPGIGEATAEKLRTAGIDSLEKVAVTSPHDLSEMAGISLENAKKAVQAAIDATTIEYSTAEAISEKRKSIGRITTSSDSLDELIGGGIEANGITEAYGRFASGKSQLGFQLSVNVQLPVGKGGMGGGVLFIDTEGTFRPERLLSMAERSGLDGDEVLKNIIVVRATTTAQQILTIERADKLIV